MTHKHISFILRGGVSLLIAGAIALACTKSEEVGPVAADAEVKKDRATKSNQLSTAELILPYFGISEFGSVGNQNFVFFEQSNEFQGSFLDSDNNGKFAYTITGFNADSNYVIVVDTLNSYALFYGPYVSDSLAQDAYFSTDGGSLVFDTSGCCSTFRVDVNNPNYTRSQQFSLALYNHIKYGDQGNFGPNSNPSSPYFHGTRCKRTESRTDCYNRTLESITANCGNTPSSVSEDGVKFLGYFWMEYSC